MNADDVLAVLGEYQEVLGWLANDGRQHLGDARLTVFRSDEHFAVFTQFPHFLYDADSFEYWVGCAGNCLQNNDYPLLSEELPLEEVLDAPLWRRDDYVHWLADRSAFSVMVEGKRYDFRPSKEDYEQVGITFEDERIGPNTINTGQFLHFLCVALNHPFFWPENKLRELIAPSVVGEMSLFLQTGYWQHPTDLVVGDEDAEEELLIKDIPCWQILARAIVSGDLGEWNSQDTSRFNTDWGSLERIYQQNNCGYRFD